jgi:hypothetical protein
MTNERTAEFYLDYFKNGEDIQRCIVRLPNNTVNIEATFNNHISLLKHSINQLNIIKNALLAEGIPLDIEAHGQYIGVTGDKDIIKKLEHDRILTELVLDEESSDGDYVSDSSDELPARKSTSDTIVYSSDSDYNSEDN